MAIGSDLGITLPTQGGNTGTWGTDLNTALQSIIDAVEGQVPSSALDFSADFELNDYGLIEVRAVAFSQQTAVTDLNSLYFKTDGDLYARDGANNEIQVSSAGSLNIASGGGLGDSGGNYGTGGITFDWDGTIYNALDGSGTDDYTAVRMSELQLQDGSSNQLTLTVPSLSADYTVTFPNAVPAALSLLQIDAAGALFYSNTVTDDITLSSGASILHGDRNLQLSACSGISDAPGGVWYGNGSGLITAGNASTNWYIPIPLPAGKRIKSIDIMGSGGDGSAKVFTLYYRTVLLASSIGSKSVTTTGTFTQTLTMTAHTIASNEAILLKCDFAHASDTLSLISVVYDAV